MNGTSILEHFRSQLADAVISRRDEVPQFEPLDISPWLAMSLMQKAIRRGREDLSLKAAATLFKVSPERFWRRICVTAFEDIGVGDFDTVAIVTAATKGKRWRAQIGGEWAVGSYLVQRMCKAVKCRATDDLAMVCDWHPAFEEARLDLTFQPTAQLLDRIMGEAALPERAIALWFSIGTDRCRSPVLRKRRGEPHAVFDAICEQGYPETIVEVCREGFRKSGGLLSAFLILLWREAQRSARSDEPDNLPDEEWIGGVPCWAYDMHVRQGNQAMARFLKTDCETSRWMVDRIPPSQRVRFLGGTLFSMESGLVDRRLRWGTGDDLHRMADLESRGVDPLEMAEVKNLLRDDLPKLNEARRYVLGSNS